MKSPVKSFRSLHAAFVAEQLKDVHERLSSSPVRNKSSHLNLCVNDSQSGAAFQETYKVKEEIGEGGFALVYRCRHKHNGMMYAVKKVDHCDYQESGGANSLKDEIAALKALKEKPYMVQLYDVFVEKSTTWLVMEEMRGGDLLDRVTAKQAYSETDAKKVTRTLVEAIRYCHNKGLAHRDVKPENILLQSPNDDTTIKLCDFGCARTYKGPYDFTTMAGSPQYAAPEVYEHVDTGGYGPQCDLWSIGVVVFVLLGGYAPFEDPNLFELTKRVCSGDWSFHQQYWHNVSEKPKDLIRGLLQVDPKARLTADQALDCNWLQRPELRLRRSLSDKGLLESSNKPAAADVDPKLYHSMENLNFDLDDPDDYNVQSPIVKSPGPAMVWIDQSPVVLRVARELKLTHRRRKTKQKLGESLRSLELLTLNESSSNNCSTSSGTGGTSSSTSLFNNLSSSKFVGNSNSNNNSMNYSGSIMNASIMNVSSASLNWGLPSIPMLETEEVAAELELEFSDSEVGGDESETKKEDQEQKTKKNETATVQATS